MICLGEDEFEVLLTTHKVNEQMKLCPVIISFNLFISQGENFLLEKDFAPTLGTSASHLPPLG